MHMDNQQHGKQEHSMHHMTPLKVYFRVWLCLIIGTILTVAVSYMDFGSANILIAMAIATFKALLVILFFMGLKYEGQENNVTFFCTFVFLSIFIGLTSSDIFYRADTMPVKVDASELPPSGPPIDVKLLAKGSSEQIAKGKQIFGQQCIACHGADGHGDGPAAAALVPHPRNFHQDAGWKNGRALAQVFKTLTNGIPGSAMASFSTLSAEDRLALAHYVRSLGANAPAVGDADIAALQKEVGGPAKVHLSIDRAIEKVSQEWEAAHKK
jgi:caa(3)-type oxidase subunit IV